MIDLALLTLTLAAASPATASVPPSATATTITSSSVSPSAASSATVTAITRADAGVVARHYTATRRALGEHPYSFGAADYAGANLWLGDFRDPDAVDARRQVWRIDNSGEVHKLPVPDGEKRVLGVWAEPAGAVIWTGAKLWRVSLDGEWKVLASVEPGASALLPLGGGYVRLGEDPLQLAYVDERGSLHDLLEVPAQAAGGMEAATGPAPRMRRALPPGGFLARAGDDRFLYVASNLAQMWLLGIDGSIRHVPIEGRTPVPLADAPPRPDYAADDAFPDRVRRVAYHGGRLVIEQTYRTTGHFTRDLDGGEVGHVPKGTEGVSGFSVIDTVDAETGEIVVRVIPSPAGGGATGTWAGFHGDDLVLVHCALPGYGESYVAFVTVE